MADTTNTPPSPSVSPFDTSDQVPSTWDAYEVMALDSYRREEPGIRIVHQELAERLRSDLTAAGIPLPNMHLFPRGLQNDAVGHGYFQLGTTPRGLVVGQSAMDIIESGRALQELPFYSASVYRTPLHNGMTNMPGMNRYYERLGNKQSLTAIHETAHHVDASLSLSDNIVRGHRASVEQTLATMAQQADIEPGMAKIPPEEKEHYALERRRNIYHAARENVADAAEVYYALSNFGPNIKRDLIDNRDYRNAVPTMRHNTGDMIERAMADFSANPRTGMRIDEATKAAAQLLEKNFDDFLLNQVTQAKALRVIHGNFSAELHNPQTAATVRTAIGGYNNLLSVITTDPECAVETAKARRALIDDNFSPLSRKKYSALNSCARPLGNDTLPNPEEQAPATLLPRPSGNDIAP